MPVTSVAPLTSVLPAAGVVPVISVDPVRCVVPCCCPGVEVKQKFWYSAGTQVVRVTFCSVFQAGSNKR